MQCVILAAGEGTRMRPLTLERPKPLIEVCGKPIAAHIIDAMPPLIDEIILVVGYKGEMMREYFKEEYGDRRVRYAVQENPKAGTADALFAVELMMNGKFLVMYGDDIHGSAALKEVVEYEHATLAAHSDTPQKFGVLQLREDGTLSGIIEKPEHPPSNLVNIGGFVVTPDIFKHRPELSIHNEFLLTDSITAYAALHPMRVVRQDIWIPIGYPEDIAKAEAILCPKD